MKAPHSPPLFNQPWYLILTILTLLIPLDLFGGDKDITIYVYCTEYIGNGKVRAYFGYENPNKKTVIIDESGSVITYNYGQAKKLGLYVFEPGVVENAFSEEFDAHDRVVWSVQMPNSEEYKTTEASFNSNHCKDAAESLNIIPGYYPPEGGKQYDSKIGAELTSLYYAYIYDPEHFEGAADAIFQLNGDSVLIEVIAMPGQYDGMMLSLLGVGFRIETEDPEAFRATGWLEIGELMNLNEFEDLFYGRPGYPGVSCYIVPGTGITNSQGDFAMHSDFVRLGYDVNGAGVKIGVLSNSFDTHDDAGQDIVNGDLPGYISEDAHNPNGYLQNVQVLKDLGEAYGTQSDEGRAMLQILHDIAPGAELAFRTGYLGEQDMADGIRELADSGCNIIVDDLTYITEPFFRDGVISQTIDSVVADSVIVFSSAGNFGRTSYCGLFSPAPEGETPVTIIGTAHNFAEEGEVVDIFQEILLKEGDYLLVMQWDDGSDEMQTTTETDLDIFLSDDAGFSVMGFNRVNTGGAPFEAMPFSVMGGDVSANIIVSRAAGPNVPVTFKYILFRGGYPLFNIIQYDQGNSTIVGHPNSAGAIAVGAVRYNMNPIYSPGSYDKPIIEPFSSMGGTPVCGIEGGLPVDRLKPDITAPDGVNTMVDMGSGDWDGDSYHNFFGTSAASPHAAGVAALILQAKVIYDDDVEDLDDMGPLLIRQLLINTAMDMEETEGYDQVSGHGFIQAHAATMTFANPKPYIENLFLDENYVHPEDVQFSVIGDFFTEDTEVLFRGEPLESGVDLRNEDTIIVTHSSFLGNPPIQVYTQAISSSGDDGGYSETKYFTDPFKLHMVVSANPAVKKFGEALPDFSASIRVININGDTIDLPDAVVAEIVTEEEATFLSQQLSLQESYYVPATDTTAAGEVVIQPELKWYEYPEEEMEYAITENYILEFVNSSLTIERLPLMITPQDVEITYGDSLPQGGLDFSYMITDGFELIEDTVWLKAKVQTEHTTALANEIALVNGITLVNGIPLIRGDALINGVRLLRGEACVNGTWILVEVEDETTNIYVDGEPLSNGGLPRGLALVNGLPYVQMTDIVNGVAMVNHCELTVEEGCITKIGNDIVDPIVQTNRGLALINGSAQVGEYFVTAVEGGVSKIGNDPVPAEGVFLINGVACVQGKPLVNSGEILRGFAVINEIDVSIENGVPDPRGLAFINGIPVERGSVMINTLEFVVNDEYEELVVEVWENGSLLSDITLENGIGGARGIPVVNGDVLANRGLAMINGLAIISNELYSDDFVNLEDMSLMASNFALTNGSFPDIRGKALVNDMPGLDSLNLVIAAGTILENGDTIYENVVPNRGLALVNGGAYLRGDALVNNETLAILNSSIDSTTINENSNRGTILVFDARDLGESPPDSLVFNPISFITGSTAGLHWIVPGTYISKNFDISYGLGTLTIHPVDVTVEPLDTFICINEGDPLPDFTFDYEGWIEGDDGNDSYIIFRDSDGIPYDPSSDNSAGTYIVMPTPDNDNYNYIIEPAILHVNPYGPGTKKIKPVLNCIQEIDEEPGYIANFEYDNGNTAAVYIPVGPDNWLDGTGIDWIKSDDQPTMFLPGGGTFVVYFNGTELSWSVSSIESDHKVSSAANANSSSTKCPPAPKSAAVSVEGNEEFACPDQLQVYPNPVTGWLHITMKGLENNDMISIHDLSGRSYRVTSVQVRSDLVELDMNSLSPGSYVIRILMKDQVIFVPVIKN